MLRKRLSQDGFWVGVHTKKLVAPRPYAMSDAETKQTLSPSLSCGTIREQIVRNRKVLFLSSRLESPSSMRRKQL